ncbi:MAG: UDP-N-acetylglucosamine 1-carboxyvinyltransferase [Lentisphaeria bacterium]
MNLFEINGGKPLRGRVTPAGNKNAALPMIAAALLTDEEVILENVPNIGDVRTMLALAEAVGAEVSWDPAAHHLRLRAANLHNPVLPDKLCADIRASILFAAPLLHRLWRAEMAPPGGDVIGRRRLDAHFQGLQALGASIDANAGYHFRAPQRLMGADIFLPEASVTATEQLVMAAVLANGRTVLRNAASEPHVQDLCLLLVKMGAVIEGIGSNTLTIDGVEKLGGAFHRILADHTEVGSFLAMAAATGGEITVTDADPAHYIMVSRAFARLGIQLRFHNGEVHLDAEQPREVVPEFGGGIPVLDDGPWPHFPSDLMSVMIVLATQVRGPALFFEKMYESRMYFVDRLIAMGANAVICDPHRVVVSGPARLHAMDISSPDIRAGTALVAAALCARGTSTIRNVHLIDRGYEGIEAKLAALGADITRK